MALGRLRSRLGRNIYICFLWLFTTQTCILKKRDVELLDHSGARFDLCTVYGHIYPGVGIQSFIVFYVKFVPAEEDLLNRNTP